jgi:hypothetical protein
MSLRATCAVVGLTVLFAALLPPPDLSAAQRVTIRTEDGVMLS